MPPPRLFVILARAARRAVVIRRGPAKLVQLLLWHLDTDTFEAGQWLKGRVYPHRCDLSPDGTLFLYFAGNWRGEPETWTAISKPPYWTALAMWPLGDTWSGGGSFESATKVFINHGPDQLTLQPGTSLPESMVVERSGPNSVGDHCPFDGDRLQRDGWIAGQSREFKRGYANCDTFDPPITYQKPSPTSDDLLHMRVLGWARNSWLSYVQEYVIERLDGTTVDLGKASWADWDANGDAVFARDGRAYRLVSGASGIEEATMLRDFANDVFEEIEAPKEALEWG